MSDGNHKTDVVMIDLDYYISLLKKEFAYDMIRKRAIKDNYIPIDEAKLLLSIED